MTTTTLYAKPTGCFGCDKTKAKFIAAGIDFTTVDVTTDEAALARIKDLGYAQVPVILITDDAGQILDQWSGLNPAKIDTLTAAAAA